MILFKVTEFWNQLKINKNSSNKEAKTKQISSLTFYHSFVIFWIISSFSFSYLNHYIVDFLKGINGTISFIIFNEHLLCITLIKISIIHISKECVSSIFIYRWSQSTFSFIQYEICLDNNHCHMYDRMMSFVKRVIHWLRMVDIYNYNISLQFSTISFATLNRL